MVIYKNLVKDSAEEMSKHPEDHLKLLEKIARIFCHKSLYLIGAGASRSHVDVKINESFDKAKNIISSHSPFTGLTLNRKYQLDKNNIIKFKISGFPYPIKAQDDQYFIETDNFDFWDYMICEKLLYETPGILDMAIAISCSLDNYPSRCYEYQIFNFINPQSIIGNLNHDSLINYFFKNKLQIINLHGIITPEFKKYLLTNLNLLISSNNNILSKKVFLANKELEESLKNSEEFIKFTNILKCDFSYLVILGYSFFRQNNEVLDTVSYERIIEYLKSNKKCKLVIIDPYPEFLADSLSSTISLNEILCFKVRWDSFAYAFFTSQSFNNKKVLFNFNSVDSKRFDHLYNLYTEHQNFLIKYNYQSEEKNILTERNFLEINFPKKSLRW